MKLAFPIILLFWLFPCSGLVAQSAQWIWHGAVRDGGECFARLRLDLATVPLSAELTASCDNHVQVYVNGHELMQSDDWWEPQRRQASGFLHKGVNVIALHGRNDNGPAALAARLDLRFADGKTRAVLTDASWRTHGQAAASWTAADFDDSSWSRPVVLGVVGQADLPWSSSVTSLGRRAPSLPSQKPAAETGLTVKPGFRVERIYTVPRQMGSLVSITAADQGRFYVSDQRAGLYRVTPAKLGDASSKTLVERLDLDLGGAQGLLWAFDSLYVVVNGRDSGLYRLRDRDGDDRLDSVELLRKLEGSGEHGPHAVILAPDGEHLYICAGNHTNLTEIVGSRLPQNWGEDLLLPRQWDANGHARGRMAPGGWICRVDKDGKNWELVGSGFRNEYDIAVDRHGELWSYDADMEWDMGLPWYRPTRVCHVVSGAEFGWRAGTGKWPVTYPDSVPPVFELGPGSPTGITFGTGTAFPLKYQRALFLLDWTFGTIYALHPSVEGASYTAQKEEFVSGKPLPVTDVTVGGDGGLYFTTGGRGAASAIYRVVYTGQEDCSPDPGKAVPEQFTARRKLESFHGRVDAQAVASAWPVLVDAAESSDRSLRYAARLAVESQPTVQWRKLALSAEGPFAINALLALARQGTEVDRSPLFDALLRQSFDKLTAQQRIGLLRAYALGFIRLGRPDLGQRTGILKALEAQFPSGDRRVDTELCRVLVYLTAPGIVAKVVEVLRASHSSSSAGEAPAWAALIDRNDGYGGPIRKMLADMPPSHEIGLAFMLRTTRHGWSMPLRRSYFEFLQRATQHPGGNSYRGFINKMRDEALENCTAEERSKLADLTGKKNAGRPAIEVTMPKGPARQWTLDSAFEAVDGQLRNRSFDAGRNLFHAAACAACHRFDGEGGSVGPDLTSLANKFTLRDVLRSIVEPSQVISDQYGSAIVYTTDGKQLHGIVVESGKGESATVSVYTLDPKAPPVTLSRQRVRRIEMSPVSQMPPGLIFALNPDELRDLCAYLLAGGNSKNKMFSKPK